ncbi:hypothetical protein BB560_004374, partial [Smittium megazygosporum]
MIKAATSLETYNKNTESSSFSIISRKYEDSNIPRTGVVSSRILNEKEIKQFQTRKYHFTEQDDQNVPFVIKERKSAVEPDMISIKEKLRIPQIRNGRMSNYLINPLKEKISLLLSEGSKLTKNIKSFESRLALFYKSYKSKPIVVPDGFNKYYMSPNITFNGVYDIVDAKSNVVKYRKISQSDDFYNYSFFKVSKDMYNNSFQPPYKLDLDFDGAFRPNANLSVSTGSTAVSVKGSSVSNTSYACSIFSLKTNATKSGIPKMKKRLEYPRKLVEQPLWDVTSPNIAYFPLYFRDISPSFVVNSNIIMIPNRRKTTYRFIYKGKHIKWKISCIENFEIPEVNNNPESHRIAMRISSHNRSRHSVYSTTECPGFTHTNPKGSYLAQCYFSGTVVAFAKIDLNSLTFPEVYLRIGNKKTTKSESFEIVESLILFTGMEVLE